MIFLKLFLDFIPAISLHPLLHVKTAVNGNSTLAVPVHYRQKLVKRNEFILHPRPIVMENTIDMHYFLTVNDDFDGDEFEEGFYIF